MLFPRCLGWQQTSRRSAPGRPAPPRPRHFRPEVLPLEDRLCPVTVLGSSPVSVPIPGVRAGDLVLVTAIGSSVEKGVEEAALRVDFGSPYGPLYFPIYPTPFKTARFLATQDGQTLIAYIEKANGNEFWEVTAAVVRRNRLSQAEKDSLTQSAAADNIAAAAAGTVAAGCAAVPSPDPVTKACALGFAISAGLLGLQANIKQKLALDPPDPNFTAIAQPVFPAVPHLTTASGFTQGEAAALNALFANEAQAIGLGEALYASINRADGAAEAGNLFWETRQLQAAAQYAGQLKNVWAAQPALLNNVVLAFQAAGFSKTVTATDVQKFQNSVAQNGLPGWLVSNLQQLGADGGTINRFRLSILQQNPQAVAGTFPAKFADPQLLSALSDAAALLAVNMDPATIHDVSSLVKVTRRKVRPGRRPGRFRQALTIHNRGSGPVNGPLVLVLKKLDRYVKLVNRTGVGRHKKPFLVIPHSGGDNLLGPGESVTVVLDFKASAGTAIRFRPQVMAGFGMP
jgi:hypothetical protein